MVLRLLPLLGLLVALVTAQTKPADAPLFQVRARVVTQKGQPPTGKKFTFRVSTAKAVGTEGSAWSDWLTFGEEQRTATLKGYPALYLKGYPVVTSLSVTGVVDPTEVEAELKFAEGGEVVKLSGELYGPSLGLMLWREDGKPRADTMAGYNRRYWKHLEGVQLPEKERPKLFPIVDRFIGGDQDRRAWKEGIEQLGRAGFSAIMLPPQKEIRDLLLSTGRKRTSWAVYSPPGYAFALDEKITPASIDDWAEKIAKPYRDAGYARDDMALFALSDEPGWYYPKMLTELAKSTAGLERFRAYLQTQKLTPKDVGFTHWDDVKPIGRSQAKEVPSRRLFYWSMRFFAHDSAQHFANSTRALEKAFAPGTPIFTNWNFFAGRCYVPGPVANNGDKTSPDAAMGGHDWLEFGRLRGSTMLWTEDWFGDGKAYQWSYYCSHLRCAAEKGGVQFGGYVIPRTAGDRADGIVQKILCVVGSGGKALKYFVFGPEYNFPGNCYSERAAVLPKMAEAHKMIGAAEDLLWPGKRPAPQVAILHPRSAQMWDAREQVVAKGISDATNHNLNGSTVDHLAEVFDIYLALQHANIPVDIVDEDDLSPEGLKRYKVVYATSPNIPAEGQTGVAAWVKAGGTLVTVSGTGQADRYDEPCTILADALGVHEKARPRLLVPNTTALKEVIRSEDDTFAAVGVVGTLDEKQAGVTAKFKDGRAARVERTVGAGRVVHFPWLPGLSYWHSARQTKDRLPAGFNERIRELIVAPTAGVTPPVRVAVPFVETPLLLSDKGAAVTLLNWRGEPVEKLAVTVRVPFAVREVTSVKLGKLDFTRSGADIVLTLPLGAADVVLLRP